MPITIADKHDRVRNIIAAFMGVPEDQVTPEKNLINDLGADSLDRVELVMSIEDEFAIEITDEDGEKVKTVQDAYDLVDRITG